MKAKILCIWCGILLIILPSLCWSQDTLFIFRYPSAREIVVSISAKIVQSASKLKYGYELKSSSQSLQRVSEFYVAYSANVDSLKGPVGWGIGFAHLGIPRVSWASRDSTRDILPGEKLDGFSFLSNGLPSIKDYYAAGWVEPPRFPEGQEPDSIIGDDVLENSVKGKTIGPVNPSEPFAPLAFLDTLISYKHQAFALGWIKNQGIVQSLDAKLENAQAQLRRNNTTAAKKILQAFINEVEALWKQESPPYGGTQITSEAYALLKFNAEYLISKL